MREEKEKHKVKIFCIDGSFIKGDVHINAGERVVDFLNDKNEDFVVITEAEVCQGANFGLFGRASSSKSVIMVNKSVIKTVEES